MTAIRQSAATFSHGTPLKIGYVVLIYLDLLLTMFALQHGFTEMNPFMIRLLRSPMELFLVKALATPFIAWLVPSLILVPSIAMMLAITGWNITGLLILL